MPFNTVNTYQQCLKVFTRQVKSTLTSINLWQSGNSKNILESQMCTKKAPKCSVKWRKHETCFDLCKSQGTPKYSNSLITAPVLCWTSKANHWSIEIFFSIYCPLSKPQNYLIHNLLLALFKFTTLDSPFWSFVFIFQRSIFLLNKAQAFRTCENNWWRFFSLPADNRPLHQCGHKASKSSWHNC